MGVTDSDSDAPGSAREGRKRAAAAGVAPVGGPGDSAPYELPPLDLAELAKWLKADLQGEEGGMAAHAGSAAAAAAAAAAQNEASRHAAASSSSHPSQFQQQQQQQRQQHHHHQSPETAKSPSPGAAAEAGEGADDRNLDLVSSALTAWAQLPEKQVDMEHLAGCTEEWLKLLKSAIPDIADVMAKATTKEEAAAALAQLVSEQQEQRRLGLLEAPSPAMTPGSNADARFPGNDAALGKSPPSRGPGASPGSLGGSGGTGGAGAGGVGLQTPGAGGAQGNGQNGIVQLGYPPDTSGAPRDPPSGIHQPEVTSQTCNFADSSEQSGENAGASSGIVNSLLMGFDRLFSDQRNEPAAGGLSKYKVQVPLQYPGVQFRKSKSLNDRYWKYAKNGTVVRGTLEDDGEWLRLADNIFLPMTVNGVQILEAVDERKTSGFWFACGQGNSAEEEEVLSNLDEIK